MNKLLDEVKELIREHYQEELKTYRFRSADEEDGIWTSIDDMLDDVDDLIREKDHQIESDLEDATIHEDDRDMESFIYNCQL